MTLVFADSSALVRCYLADEPDHEVLRDQLLTSGVPVIASQLADVEVPRALHVAARTRRVPPDQARVLLAAFDGHTSRAGPVRLVQLRAAVVPRARELVAVHRLRTLDALHLAVADTDGRMLLEPGEGLRFVTRDDDQRKAATALGFAPG